MEERANRTKHIKDLRLVEYKGDLLTLSVDAPLPPGTRVMFSISSSAEGINQEISGKISSVTRTREGRFELVVRAGGLSKAQKEACLFILSATTASP